MDRGAWQAIVYGVTRVGHDLVTKHHIQYTVNFSTVVMLPEDMEQYYNKWKKITHK